MPKCKHCGLPIRMMSDWIHNHPTNTVFRCDGKAWTNDQDVEDSGTTLATYDPKSDAIKKYYEALGKN